MLYEFKTPVEYDKFISLYTTGAFSTLDMEPFIDEVKKLLPGQTYVEIGVDKGKSLTVAALAAQEGVNIVGIDIYDAPERQQYFREVGWTQKVVFIHGFSHVVSKIWSAPIHVLFIDGNHSYEEVKQDIEDWSKFVIPGGAIFFHDCDTSSPGVVQAVNEAYGQRVMLFKRESKNTSMAMVRI